MTFLCQVWQDRNVYLEAETGWCCQHDSGFNDELMYDFSENASSACLEYELRTVCRRFDPTKRKRTADREQHPTFGLTVSLQGKVRSFTCVCS